MMEYLVCRMERPDWDAIPAALMRHTGWLPLCPVSAWAQACHDGTRLYLRLQAEERAIRATLKGPLDPVCQDSCLEFFFAPLAEDERYFNFEWNPLGTLYLGFGIGREIRVRQIVQDRELFRPRPFFTEGGWGIEFSIPETFFQIYMPTFRLSGRSHGNFYKCADQSEIPHYLAWSVPTCGTPDFHRREDFGTMLFT